MRAGGKSSLSGVFLLAEGADIAGKFPSPLNQRKVLLCS